MDFRGLALLFAVGLVFIALFGVMRFITPGL